MQPSGPTFYCCGHPASRSPSASCVSFISPTRSAGGLPAACICATVSPVAATHSLHAYLLHPLHNEFPILCIFVAVSLPLKAAHDLSHKSLLLLVPLPVLGVQLAFVDLHPAGEFVVQILHRLV